MVLRVAYNVLYIYVCHRLRKLSLVIDRLHCAAVLTSGIAKGLIMTSPLVTAFVVRQF